MNSVRENLIAGKYHPEVPPQIDKVPITDDMTVKQAREYEAAELIRKLERRKSYRIAQSAAKELFRSDLELEHGIVGHPKAEKLWDLAWDHGHSFGYSEVINFYEDFVELIQA